MSTRTEETTTRFEKVTALLKEAAKGRSKAFGGAPLWTLSRERFLEASIEGIRLVAPEPHGSCCGHDEATAATPRSEKSGLLLGLRGLAPFDGSRFPRLPWGEAPLPDEDIQFIADWVDDGCPADRELASFPVGELLSRFEPATVSMPELDTPAKEYVYRPGELKQRMNIDCMSEAQLEKLRRAFRELYALNRWPEDSRSYNNLALVHQNHCQHGWERFLPWHRIYLYEFEQAMQDRCPDVTMPYWDWTMPQYRPERPDEGWRVPKAMQAFLTEASFELLERNGIPTKPLESLLERSFTSSRKFFDAVGKKIDKKYTQGEYRNRFLDALLDANPLWYPLRYPGEFFQNGSSTTINKRIHYHYPSSDDIEQILSLRSFRDFGGGSLYNDAFGFLDQNPHNTMHIWTGGMNPDHEVAPNAPPDRNRAVRVAGRKFHKREDLYGQPEFGDMFSNLTAAYDPIFWPVHANVDRLWWEWQQRHPENDPRELDAVLTPWSYTTSDTLDMHRFGYEYVKACHVIPVGLETPVGRFVSAPIEVDERVRASFQRAEVRLHRVPQLSRSCFIRCFLNLPEASASTDMDRDEYAGYLAVFGHGACYGGPGHCDIPPKTRRPYDLRPRSHNTPRNHRIDVTQSARKLFDKGATSLQLSLVVLGADYEEDRELLRLEGVSLNFLD